MLREFLRKLESGEWQPRDALEFCLVRIHGRDAEVRAWAAVNPQPAAANGSLSGIPFGVKDIFDTRDLPTAWGSPLYAGRRTESDAAVVAHLRGHGAVLLGKTATAAFGYFDPPPTRNPRAPGHTPGGSSSGSAAAVAAGMVPFAIGAQTQGSVLRPASYCGICGFKPTFGLIPAEGALPFAPSLDTVGFFTETAADMRELWLRGFGGSTAAPPRRAARVDVPVSPAMQAAFDRALQILSANGFPVRRFDPPSGFDRLLQASRAINDYEGARSHQALWREFGSRIGAKLSALVERGLALPAAAYEDALQTVAAMKSAFASVFEEYPLLLTPAATGAPPAGLESTGDPAANAAWTALRVPAISVPMPATDLPLGLQAVAGWGRESELLASAIEVERVLQGA